jgi:hypothetical protein
MNYYGVSRDRISIVGGGWGPIEPFFGEKDYANGPILCVAKMRFEDKGGRLLIEAFRNRETESATVAPSHSRPEFVSWLD